MISIGPLFFRNYLHQVLDQNIGNRQKDGRTICLSLGDWVHASLTIQVGGHPYRYINPFAHTMFSLLRLRNINHANGDLASLALRKSIYEAELKFNSTLGR